MDGPAPFPTSLRPLDGGHSEETFLGETAGEAVVVRIYGGRSLARGPHAAEVDAAVLDLVRPLVPVPRVLEVRRGDPGTGLPGLLLTELLPGERLEQVLPDLGAVERWRVGEAVGTVLGRLGHVLQPRDGLFTDRGLVASPLPPELRDLPTCVAHHERPLRALLADTHLEQLLEVADRAQDLLDEAGRSVLVHGDLNAKNLLVDRATLEVVGVLDWEFAHAGSPYADLGNALRFDRDPAYADAVVGAYRDLMPATVPETRAELVDRARAADLVALVDLAVRAQENPVVLRARELLAAVASSGDLHAT